MINKTQLLGNLGKDPEMKYTQGGTAVCKFSVATTRTMKDREGNRKEETQWHSVVTFGKLAELCAEYLAKGRKVFVEGWIRYSKSDGADGVTRYYTDIVADEVKFLDRSDRENSTPSRREPQPAPAPAKTADFGADFADDDIPF